MGRSYLEETDEQRGGVPSLTGARLKIKEIERSKTSERAKVPGARMYVVTFTIVEPKQFKGMEVRDWITVGTPDDLTAKRPETWKTGTERGAGRIKRLLVRSGTPLSEDDEEWIEAAEGNEVIAPIIDNGPDFDGPRNKVGLFYRESDEDCPVIGKAEEGSARGGGGRKGGGRKGAAAAAQRLRPSATVREDEEEEDEITKPAKPTKQVAKDDDEDDEPPKKSKSKAVKPSQDDDEDDDEDEPVKTKKKVVKDDDDDDDD